MHSGQSQAKIVKQYLKVRDHVFDNSSLPQQVYSAVDHVMVNNALSTRNLTIIHVNLWLMFFSTTLNFNIDSCIDRVPGNISKS